MFGSDTWGVESPHLVFGTGVFVLWLAQVHSSACREGRAGVLGSGCAFHLVLWTWYSFQPVCHHCGEHPQSPP